MLKNILPITVILLLIISFISFALPEGSYDIEFISYFIIFSLITFVVAKYILKKAYNHITVGFIMIILFYLYSFIGSVNYYIVKFIFPGFQGGIENTFKYWLAYTGFFIVGYLIFLKKFQYIRPKKFVYEYSSILIVFLVIIGFIGTIGAFMKIGFIPILIKGAGDKRYFSDMGVFLDIWSLNLPTSILVFYSYLKTRKKRLLILFSFVIIQNALFIARYNFMFAALACLLLYLAHTKLTRKLIFYSFALMLLLFIVNSLYLRQRQGKENLLETKNKGELSTIQTNYVYVTFNEFRQLNILVNSYDDWLYGETFLSIPVSFMPAQFWDAFGINKREIKEINSALILKEQLGSIGGLRTGLAGELFINFGFWGSIIMILLGAIFAFLDNFYRALPMNDMRKIIVIVFVVILVYGCLVGQIDSIASGLATNTQFFLIIYLFFTKKFPIRTNIND